MWSDFAEYIIKYYAQSTCIVEVGVGCFTKVARTLEEHLKVDIVMTDIKPCHEGIVQDDISNPDIKIYKDAALIYSIRPPEELHPYLEELARELKADLIIKPLSTDLINTREKMKLVNYNKAFFYKKKL
jgi:uncharacterized UPF0146 family protein